MRKGQISVLIASIMGAFTILSAAVGYAVTNNDRVGRVETRASVLEAQYANIDKKLDQLIDAANGKKQSSVASSSYSTTIKNGRN